MQKYRILGKKGEGTFSEVLKCQNTQNGNFYACKRMKQQFDSIDQVNNLREIQAMRRLSPHANIVELHEVIYDKKTGTLALICELLDLNLYEYIKGKKEYLPEQKCCFFIYQALKGLDHMHRNGIFHRDIKPENILVKNDSVKLADFGSCRSVYSKQPYTEYISTRWYRPPECLLTDGYYTYKMDIWSLGCVFYEIMMLRPLFPGSNEVDQIARIHQILGTPSQTLLSRLKKSRHMSFNFPPRKREGIGPLMQHASLDCRNIIEYMCTYDPEERPSAKQILRQLYFRHLRDADKRAAAIAKSSIADDRNIPKSHANISNNSEDKEQDFMLPKMNARNAKMSIQPFGLPTFNTFAMNGPGGSDKLPKHRKESKHHIPKINGYTALPKIPIATNKSSFPSSFPTALRPANPSLKPKETTRSKIPYGTILPAIKDIRGDHKY